MSLTPTQTIPADCPSSAIPEAGRGFAYFAHYRLLQGEICKALVAAGERHIGQYNDAETRQQMLGELSRFLDRFAPLQTWVIEVIE